MTTQKRTIKMLQKSANNLRSAKRTKPKKSKSAHQTNTIKDILTGRGFKTIVPTDDMLQTLDISMIRFNKILDNKVGLTLNEATGFANWLGVTVEELTPNHPPTVADKYGLNN